MLPIFRIWAVALYEMKALMRSTVFRVFLFFTLLVFVYSAIVYLLYESYHWWYLAIPDSIPYRVLMIMGLVQAVFVVLVAASSLDERKIDTSGILHARPVSNAGFVFGKLVGISLTMTLVNVFLLSLILILNAVFMDVPVAFAAYLAYPLLLSIPSLVFVIGFVFLLWTFIQNYALVVTLAEGCLIALTLFYGSALYNLADPLAYRLPMMHSDFTGFGNLEAILCHRGTYLLLGLGFAFAAVLRYGRLPQSCKMNGIALGGIAIGLTGGILLGQAYLSPITGGQVMRDSMRELNRQAVMKPRVTIENMRLELIHRGGEIETTAHLIFRNSTSEPLKEYIFSLNTGLRVASITGTSGKVPFTRNVHLLTVTPPQPLAPGAVDMLVVHYRGAIDERACYIDVDEKVRRTIHRKGFFVYDKRHAFITPQYVLLTPEAYWYPRVGIPRGSVFPQSLGQDLMDVRLMVRTHDDLTVLSQGEARKTGPGCIVFRPELPLPGLSLVIGKYEKRAAQVDGKEYALFIRPGHDFFSKDLKDLTRKDVEEIIKNEVQNWEWPIVPGYQYRWKTLCDPYSRFSIIEVPVQFLAYERFWTLSNETVQPMQALVPEKGALFLNDLTPWYGPKPFTPIEAESNSFRDFIQYMFRWGGNNGFFQMRQIISHREQPGISKSKIYAQFESQFEGNYCLLPGFFLFPHSFSTEAHPFFGLMLEYYLKTLTYPVSPGIPQDEVDALVADYLSRNTLAEILNGPFRVDIKYEVLRSKSKEFFTSVRQKIGDERFSSFLDNYLYKTRFHTISADDFIRTAWDSCGVDLAPLLARWEKGEKLPAFLISDVHYREVKLGNTIKYQVEFTITNPEPVEGTISASLFSGDANIQRLIAVPGNTTKQVGIVGSEPFGERIQFDTFISKNQPAAFRIRFREPVQEKGGELFDGERVIERGHENSKGTIIVDNTDPGFHAVVPEERNFLRRFVAAHMAKAAAPEYQIQFNIWSPPQRWQPIIMSCFYGHVQKTAVYIQSGVGNCSASWEATIPEKGNYEIFAYTPSARWLSMGGPLVQDLHFTIHYEDGAAERTLKISECEEGWTSLGTYRLPVGNNRAELSDKSKGKFVYADAVKWVRKSDEITNGHR